MPSLLESLKELSARDRKLREKAERIKKNMEAQQEAAKQVSREIKGEGA